MPDVLILGDTFRSPELRHEIPAPAADPLLYVEHGGERHVVVTAFEIPIIEEVGDYVAHPFEEFGADELRRSSSSHLAMLEEIAVRAVRKLGVERAVVPWAFPVSAADRLRAEGVELVVDQGFFDDRRRVKTGAELAGIRRAQLAAEAGMAAARDLLAASETDDGGVLQLDGEPLTSERVKAAISAVFLEHDVVSDGFVVSHGAQAAIGHHLGSGRLRANETIVVDLWPRDRRSACSADMTRTFVVGEPPAEAAEWHRLCLEALERVVAGARAGVTGSALNDVACEIFEGAGHLTQRTKVFGEALDHGFHHALGHGVGLEVHEQPLLNLLGRSPLVDGDVIAVEPGLYRPGFGGVRIEDLLLVAADGCENLTRFPYDLVV